MSTSTVLDVQAGAFVGRLVKVALLVRLLALTFAVLVLALGDGDLLAIALFCGVVLTSHLGLQRPDVRQLVVRHPALALPDLVMVAAVPVFVGVDSPLTVVSVSSALLIGVLFAEKTALPLALMLALAHVPAGTTWHLADVDALLRFPIILVSVTAVGSAVRRMALQQRASDERSVLALSAASAAEERLRLARDLHDTVAKSVQGVALIATALPAWIARDVDTAQRHAIQVADGANEAVVAARHLLSSLRLDDPERPFGAVVDELVYRWEAEHDQQVVRRIDRVPPLPPGHRHELLCGIREALENVARHAPKATVTFELTHRDGEVVATVADDGPGFPADREAQANDAGHYGLTGMRERLAAVGGVAEIDSAPGAGTRVRFTLPAGSTIALTRFDAPATARALSMENGVR